MVATHQEGRLPGVGGLELYTQAWLPADGAEPRAVVVLSHGASEHSGRYAWVAEQLVARGLAIYTLDHRGHGRSEGPRALIDRLPNAVEDLHARVEEAAAAHPGRPVFLLGHSVGGAIGLSYTLQRRGRLDGLILSAPVAALEAASPVERILGRALSAVAPKLGVFAIDSSTVSRDPEVVRAYDADPLNYHGKLPARTVAELANAIDSYPALVPALQLPLLVMHGTEDRLVPIAGSEMIAERAGSADKTFTRYEGLYHEILNEPERELVVEEIAGWIEARVS